MKVFLIGVAFVLLSGCAERHNLVLCDFEQAKAYTAKKRTSGKLSARRAEDLDYMCQR